MGRFSEHCLRAWGPLHRQRCHLWSWMSTSLVVAMVCALFLGTSAEDMFLPSCQDSRYSSGAELSACSCGVLCIAEKRGTYEAPLNEASHMCLGKRSNVPIVKECFCSFHTLNKLHVLAFLFTKHQGDVLHFEPKCSLKGIHLIRTTP